MSKQTAFLGHAHAMDKVVFKLHHKWTQTTADLILRYTHKYL